MTRRDTGSQQTSRPSRSKSRPLVPAFSRKTFFTPSGVSWWMPFAPLVSTPSFGSHAGPSPRGAVAAATCQLRPGLEDRLVVLLRRPRSGEAEFLEHVVGRGDDEVLLLAEQLEHVRCRLVGRCEFVGLERLARRRTRRPRSRRRFASHRRREVPDVADVAEDARRERAEALVRCTARR